MPVLDSTQRSQLEKAVIKARKLSVRGAYNTLEAFAVDNYEPYAHMNAEDRELRNKLRSKARLLGDTTTTDGGHTIDKLAYELAYEYWHQMLFAKFLEANGLLMHPEHGIAVSMEECEELGQEEGFENKWQAAANYASRMLPAIFRQDDPLMQLKYATEDRLALEELIEDIAEDVFQADDSLGWVYQYWQTEEKERINKKGDKIDGDSISAVTQLFTEPYMVHFLIDNTLGAWWTARNPGVTSPFEFKYLRTLDNGTPAAGSFDGWPETLSEITMLDPCMGSGHFVVDVFMAMATLRMHDEKLSKADACDAVIRDNVHGLELDARCTQIAAFNLALAAWKFCGEYRILPEMNLACCGIAPKGKKEDWVKLANSEQDAEKRTRLKGGLERMFDLFQLAPELGSLIDPTTIERDAFTSDFEELQPFLEEALKAEIGKKANERTVIAAGVAKAGEILTQRYTVVYTNVPFLGKNSFSDFFQAYVKEHFALAKSDLSTVFIARLFSIIEEDGIIAAVSPHSWYFSNPYTKFRKHILQNATIKMVGKLGPGAFSEISGEIVNVNLNFLTNGINKGVTSFVNVADKKGIDAKKESLVSCSIVGIPQVDQLKNPDFRIIDHLNHEGERLSNYCNGYHGQGTFDKECFCFNAWEVMNIKPKWELQQATPSNHNKHDYGASQIIRWENGQGLLYSMMELKRLDGYTSGKWRAGIQIWGEQGIAVSGMTNLFFAPYLGGSFDENVAVLYPKKHEDLLSINAFCADGEFQVELKKIDENLKASCNTLVKVPFDKGYWQKVAEEKYSNGLPKPYSDDPTQWLFHGHPFHTESPLQVAIARLMGYEWPAENDNEMELSDEAKEKIRAIRELELPFDEDGIVCIPSVNGEASASDRIRENIISIWGEDYDVSTLSNLIAQEGSKMRNIESYLRDDFFPQHCKLFKNRPFIWHIWDGRKDGFAALVNYHKLDEATLKKLIYTYLGDWINQCELKMQNNVSGADGLLSAAKALKEKLVLILEGEPPYDLFIRWKSLEEQPIGWDPDINDGVRMNVYPFIEAGVLRKKFNVKWGKDRGKNPSGSHWGPDRFNRYEDLEDEWKLKDENGNLIPSLSNEVKRKAKKKNG